MQLNVNTDATVALTNRLERLHRSAFPSAVRGALNMAAFDVKTNTLQDSSKKAFKNRSPNFFKAFSGVKKATGFNIGQMKATISMNEKGLQGDSNFAVKDLEEQERGGTIKAKSFIPLAGARVGNSFNKPVKKVNRVGNFGTITNVKRSHAKNKKSAFVLSAAEAGAGGLLLGDEKGGKQILWRINSVRTNIKSRQTTVRKTAIYTYQKGRTVNVQGTNFMKKAATITSEKMVKFYEKEALFQFKKYM